LWGAVIVLCFAASVAADPVIEDLGDAIGGAVVLGRPVPDVPDDLPETTAYQVQAFWVNALYGTKSAGYKAGLTSALTQQRFSVREPVIGILPLLSRVPPGAEIARADGLAVEVEIGVLVGIDGEPAGLVPAIELPRLHFGAPDRLALADIIAANVSAHRFLIGSPVPVDAEVRRRRVTLERDGVLLNEAFAVDALGDPLAAYRWLVAKARDLDYRIEPGMIVLTGALGRVVDGEAGHYVARYDGMGELRFSIR
jgi:2-keto-4-pentenoate hydratase